MKFRKLVYDENIKGYKPQWFGKDKFLQIDKNNSESIKEFYKYRSIIALITLKGEISSKQDFGFEGMLGKKSRDLIDIEVQEILKNNVGLTLLEFKSELIDRTYKCSWQGMTPSGEIVNMGVTL